MPGSTRCAILGALKLPAVTTTRALQLFQVMRQGAVLLNSVILAKSGLSTAQIGFYEILLYIGTILTFFWVNGLLQAMPASYARLSSTDQKDFLFNNFLVFCGIALLLFAIMLLGSSVILPILTGLSSLPYYTLFCTYLLFNLPSFPVEYIYLLHKKPLHIVTWGFFSFGLQIVAVALPLFLGFGLWASLASLVAMAILKFGWTAFTVLKFSRIKFRPDLIRSYLIFAGPLMLNVLIGNFVIMFDHWLVGWWYHDEAVFAIFRYGAREFPLVQALASALGVALIPRISEDFQAGLADMKSMTRKLGNLLFPLTIVLLFISKPLFPMVFNPNFAQSAGLFNIYLLMTASRLWLPNSIILAQGAPVVIFRVGLLELFCKIALGFLMLYGFGLPGLAWSAVLTFWVEKAGLAWYLRQKHQVRLSSWLDVRWFISWTCALAVAYGLSLCLF
jgi:O-antigen/teichoic acid export membrane protein